MVKENDAAVLAFLRCLAELYALFLLLLRKIIIYGSINYMEPTANNSKLILTIAITALISALVVGGGVFVWQRSVAQKEVQQAIQKAQQEALQQLKQNDTPDSKEPIVKNNPNGVENNSYEYQGVRLDFEAVPESRNDVTVYLTQHNKKMKLIENVTVDIPSGTYPQFKKTKNPDVALLQGGTGDSGRGFLEYYYIVLSTKRVIKISAGTGGIDKGPFIEITDSSTKSTSNIELDEVPLCIENKAYKNKKSLLRGFIINEKESYNFPSPEIITCTGWEDVGPVASPDPDISYAGIKDDLSEIYFSFTTSKVKEEENSLWWAELGRYLEERGYVYNLATHTINPASPSSLLHPLEQ